MKNRNLFIGILVILVGAGSFFAGTKYQQSKGFSRTAMPSGEMHRGMADQQGEVAGARHREDSGMIYGEIISQDETSITVKLPDDSSKIILISENTGINKATEGSVDDLETGKQVMIFGQANPDGSILATQIQLNFGYFTR